MRTAVRWVALLVKERVAAKELWKAATKVTHSAVHLEMLTVAWMGGLWVATTAVLMAAN